MPIIEGQNSAGLGISANFLAAYTEYQTVNKTDQYYMSIIQFGTWLLANFATIAEVEKELPKYKIWGSNKVNLGPAPPTIHYIITDKSGANIVVEFIKGQLHIYTNTVGVLSNEPTYDWHLANLGGYIALSKRRSASVTTPAGDVSQLDQGAGVFGLPGDFSSPARFLRATFLRYYSDPVKTDAQAVQLAIHILNNVDVPYGVIKRNLNNEKTASDKVKPNTEIIYTQWLAVKDLTHNKLYFSDYNHRGTMLTINLDKFFVLPEPKNIPISEFQYPTNDITDSLIK
jgi:penicillin V acylase-like amidase (Ntn superfamily)